MKQLIALFTAGMVVMILTACGEQPAKPEAASGETPAAEAAPGTIPAGAASHGTEPSAEAAPAEAPAHSE